MEWLTKLELFSYTIENRFVFSLFDLLLCGVILLVILRKWRVETGPALKRADLLLFLSFLFLGAAFAVGAVYAGAFLFFQIHLAEATCALLSHALQAGAWLLLAASAGYRMQRSQPGTTREPPFGPAAWLLLAFLPFALAPLALLNPATALDLANLLALALALVLFYRRPLGGQNLATGAVAFMVLAAALHLGVPLAPEAGRTPALWNFEQFSWSTSLFAFAVAIGETSRDLFDRVFVRLQVAFILLASVMILVVTQTEKADHLAGIRGRTDPLAEFVGAHVDYFRQRHEPLASAVKQEDFLRRVTLGFANLPELKRIHIRAGQQALTFEISDEGKIQQRQETDAQPVEPLDGDAYFLIQELPSKAGAGSVAFYGAREFLNRHIRKRISVMFLLFTGMVALSTLMIGMVVRGASATILQQAQAIEEQQQQLLQASKLAAIGELAAGVAHEINNPATTIMSRASFLLSQADGRSASDRDDLNAIVGQAVRIAQVTRGLLTFSRPLALELRPLALERVIRESLGSVEELLDLRRICVEKELPPDLPAVRGDQPSLSRALENIFRNAVDAMPQGGTLSVRAVAEGSAGRAVRLKISDTGVGIEPDTLARIFDPFFTTKEAGKGTGLGLAIVHGIIQEHGGSITAESRTGAGTTFVISLPAEPTR